jgi:predicted TIM-barrel fold metal-dependent hydrolase
MSHRTRSTLQQSANPHLLYLCAGLLFAAFTLETTAQERLPVIDMHLHALTADSEGPPPLAMCTPMNPMPSWDQASPYGETWLRLMKEPNCEDPVWSPMTDEELMSRTIEAMQRRNIIGVLSGTPNRVAAWMTSAPGRFYPGYGFRLSDDVISPDGLAALHQDGRLAVLAEITNQYLGIAPDDERMEPYWAMAEEMDIPVGIHIGTGPPGVIYLGPAAYRARLHSALTIEEVLVRHPKLRVYIMHAGYPMLEDLLAVMYAHPQVYVEVGVIVYTQPRPAFYRFLGGIIDAGFGDRVMFGSDQMVWPEVIERGIKVIEEAPFLNQVQKRQLLYDNAARFLRLSKEEIAQHHRM